MNIPELQQQALEEIASRRQTGEALAIIPAYIGPWAVAAADAARFVAENPNEQALIVYPHDQLRERFTDYISTTATNTTVASPDTVARGGHDDFAYVATRADIWPRVQRSLNPHFALRHSRTPIVGVRSVGAIVLPTYQQLGRGKLEWGREDSIRYYRELYFDKGGVVSGEEVYDLANQGQGPHKIRLFQDDLNGMEKLRAAAGLEGNIYHRGLTLERRAQILSDIGDALGHTPSTTEIKDILRATDGPSYDTLVRDVGLAELRRLAGQDASRRANARRETMGEWTALDSALLYHKLCREAERLLTRRELEPRLAGYQGDRKPTIDEMLAPFMGDRGDNLTPFKRLQNTIVFPGRPQSDD